MSWHASLPPARSGGRSQERGRDLPSHGRFGSLPVVQEKNLQAQLPARPTRVLLRCLRMTEVPNTCISCLVLVSRSRSLSVQGLNANFGSPHPEERKQSRINISKRKAAHSVFKVTLRCPPPTASSPKICKHLVNFSESSGVNIPIKQFNLGMMFILIVLIHPHRERRSSFQRSVSVWILHRSQRKLQDTVSQWLAYAQVADGEDELTRV